MRFLFWCLGHAPGWDLGGGVRGGPKKFEHDHETYQFDGDDETNRMQVKFHPRVKLVTLWWINFNKKVNKVAKIRNRYNQVPHLAQDTNGKVTNSQLDTIESQEVSPFPAGDHKAHINRRAQRHSKHKTVKTLKIHKRSTALERSVKYFTWGLKPV